MINNKKIDTKLHDTGMNWHKALYFIPLPIRMGFTLESYILKEG